MKKRLIFPLLSVITLVLELLPWGAVLYFGNPEGESIRSTCSYFSLTPYGYANFGPLLTALVTCVLLVLTILYAFKNKNGLRRTITVLAAVAVLLSLLPLLYGLRFYSVVGGLISVALLLQLLLSLKKDA